MWFNELSPNTGPYTLSHTYPEPLPTVRHIFACDWFFQCIHEDLHWQTVFNFAFTVSLCIRHVISLSNRKWLTSGRIIQPLKPACIVIKEMSWSSKCCREILTKVSFGLQTPNNFTLHHCTMPSYLPQLPQ